MHEDMASTREEHHVMLNAKERLALPTQASSTSSVVMTSYTARMCVEPNGSGQKHVFNHRAWTHVPT